jgi:divalent metal cation (Fe/Co/Zn/Cd) transporter
MESSTKLVGGQLELVEASELKVEVAKELEEKDPENAEALIKENTDGKDTK